MSVNSSILFTSQTTLLQVADSKTPSSWQLDGVVFLSVEMQREMNLSILQHNLTASYARKMVGFVYAIRQGAELIFETDDDNFPLEGDNLHLGRQTLVYC